MSEFGDIVDTDGLSADEEARLRRVHDLRRRAHEIWVARGDREKQRVASPRAWHQSVNRAHERRYSRSW